MASREQRTGPPEFTESPVEIRAFNLVAGGRLLDACIVDHDIELSEGRDGSGKHLPHLLLVRDVGLNNEFGSTAIRTGRAGKRLRGICLRAAFRIDCDIAPTAANRMAIRLRWLAGWKGGTNAQLAWPIPEDAPVVRIFLPFNRSICITPISGQRKNSEARLP
jgi:hypothetical protein